jgi:hypothetical protein
MAEPAQGLLDLRGFHFELPPVADVLVGAPAASAKVGAARLDAIRRRSIHGEEFGLGELFLPLREARRDLLARDDERHEDSQAINPADPLPSEGDIVNRELENLAQVRNWLHAEDQEKEKGLSPLRTKAPGEWVAP